MDNINETYKPALLSAEKQLKYLRNLPSQQWTIVNNNESTCEIYTHEAGQAKTLKAVKDLSANQIDLRHIYASLRTIEMRTKCKNLLRIMLLLVILKLHVSNSDRVSIVQRFKRKSSKSKYQHYKSQNSNQLP